MSIDITEQHNLKFFLSGVFGPQVQSWAMNEKMFTLTYKLLTESAKCSNLMDLVPRPMPLGANPIGYLTKQARGIFLRKLKDNKQHYIVCVKTSAVRMKTKFLMAASGI